MKLTHNKFVNNRPLGWTAKCAASQQRVPLQMALCIQRELRIMLEELIAYLDLPDTDIWYDYGCVGARNIIDQNVDGFMTELSQEWRTWPTMRQEHLAYILGESNFSSELSLINEMLSSENSDVAYRAKEALDDFNQKT